MAISSQALLFVADKPPEVDDPIANDHVAIAEIGPILLFHSGWELKSDVAIGVRPFVSGVQVRRQRLDEIGDLVPSPPVMRIRPRDDLFPRMPGCAGPVWAKTGPPMG